MTDERNPGGAFDVAFIGRANIDLTVHVPHRARPGRTVFGSALTAGPGGKSLNQAIATARRGGRACLVANLGADTWGHQIRAALVDAGVDTRHLTLIPDVTTGAAIIEVTPDGESYITLARSPATELNAHDIRRTVTSLDTQAVVVQLDLPPGPVGEVLQHRPAPLVVGNLVPHTDLDVALLEHLDALVVNEHEAAAILHTAPDDPLAAAGALRRLGIGTVVVTAGSHGAAFAGPGVSGRVPAPAVPVVDTTGAGDAFLGSLVLDLARGMPLAQAVTTAVTVGSQTVQHRGTDAP
ncbi:ribokinase [Micromonospora globbae]|uniref:Ribokinase n=1 Tax=Micromonospora globbae TaxID=1894969 RepID=A0A420ESF4_9ACTN|nr:ribokinase [Micromonospora globbae]RKF23618.1 ribokinase [Micromonospora globbae]